MDKKLMKLSCPFTWEMKNVIENQNKLLETKDDRLEMVTDTQEDFQEFILIYHLMITYESVVQNDLQSAMQHLNKAEESFAEIKKKGTLRNVERVLHHIFMSTKCHVLEKLGDQSTIKVEKLLREICDVKDMNKIELAMLNACQCLAWSLYYVTDNLKSINFAKKAIELEPNNGKWQYLLGKNYRRLRRMHTSIFQSPNEDEISAYEKAYELSKNNVLFGVSLAQLYKDCRNQNMAVKIYKEVYALQPTSCTVRLQLALGFIRAREPLLAKNCLTYVGARMPEGVVYTHYMGIYEEKCNKNHRAALPYYKSTTEKGNFGGEWQFIKCKKQVEQNWNPLPYMLELLKKYEKDSDRVLQDINIQIGFYYLFDLNDIQNACQYLTKAIKIEPNAYQIKVNYPLFRPSERLNVYDVLIRSVRSILENGRIDRETRAMYEDILDFCRNNRQG